MIDEKGISALMTDVLARWEVPGAAVAIVAGGESLSRGYGLREAGQPGEVDGETIFAIGSTTKAFTSVLVGMLVDEGRLGWDDPVIKYLPDFALPDPWVTCRVTVRDLLCHRLGLGRAQRLYYYGYDQREIVRRMRYLPEVAGFRSQFHYANQQYGAAGLVIEAASGETWSDFITARIFKPLGMRRTASGFDRLTDRANVALPHAALNETYPAGVRFLGEKTLIEWLPLSGEPAGSILTTANDLVPWLKVLASGGSPLLSRAAFGEITSPQMVMHHLTDSELAPLYLLRPGTRFWTYGLGWWVMDYRGEKVVMHGGQVSGFNSAVAFFPERGIGLAVLVNTHQTLAHAALFYALSDLLLGGEGRDWNGEFLQLARGYMEQVRGMEETKRAARGIENPSFELQAAAGIYRNDLFGEMVVTIEAGRLGMRYGRIQARLEHREANTFTAKWNLPGVMSDAAVRFDPVAGSLTVLDDQAVYIKS